MAEDSKHGSIDLGNLNIHMGIDGVDIVASEMNRVQNEARKLVSTLNSISRGNDVNKYWNTQASTLNGVAEAYRNFNMIQSESNASTLVKSFNAFVASGGKTEDLIDRLGYGFENTVRRAKDIVPAISEAFSVDRLRDSFSALNTFVNDYGVDINELMENIGSGSAEALKRELRLVQGILEETQQELESTQAELRKYSGSEFEEALAKASEYDSLISRAKKEFSDFLRAQNVNDYDIWNQDSGKFSRIFEAISNGSLTAKQAITKFKATYSELLADTSSGEISTAALENFESKLEEILNEIKSTQDQIRSLVSQDIGGMIREGAANFDGVSASQRDAIMSISDSAPALQVVADVLRQLIVDSDGAQAEIDETYDSLTRLLSALQGLASNDYTNLTQLGIILRNISELNGIDINGKSLDTLAAGLASLQQISNTTALQALSHVDFSKFSNLKISKTPLNNLATYLPMIASVDIEAIQRVSQLDLSSLSNLKFTKGNAESFGSLTNTIGDISTSADAFKGLDNLVTELNKLNGVKITKGTVDNIVNLLDALGDFHIDPNINNLSGLSNLDLSNLANLKINKTSLYNLATYLPAISQVDVGKVEALSRIDFGNWTNFDVKPGSLEQFESLLEKIGSTQVAIFNTGDQQYSSKTLEEGTARYARALSAVDKALVSARENSRKWTAAQTGESSGAYNKLLASISALEELRDNLDSYSGSAFREQLDKINADINEAINTMSANNERFNADAMKKNSVEYINALTQISNAIKGVESQSDRYKNIFAGTEAGSAEIENLTNLTEKLRALKEEVESDGGMSKDTFRERFAEIKKEASELNEVLAKLAREQQGTLVQGTKGYNDALTKLNSMLIQVAENSEKWESSKNGRTSANYEEYIAQGEAIRQLMSDIQAGNVTQKEFQERSAEIARTMKENEAAIRAEGEAVKSLGSSFQGVLGILLRYFSLTRIMMAAINKAKEMVNTSMDIESAMTRIQIVTSSTDAQMEHFFEATAAQAKSLGKNLTDVAGSIETFSRLGYSISDASELSKYATIMSNVADVDVGAATTGITSIIKGFDMKASDAEHVSDVLVQVGQKYAISAEELMEAFERGGAALNASGTSFEKSAALFAATNASLQNASTTGTLWKTNILSLHTEMCA